MFKEDAKLLIPHSQYYCTWCPYLVHRRVTKTKLKRMIKEGIVDWCLPPSVHREKIIYNKKVTGKKYQLEYCLYLNWYLSIQDEVKDCDVNCEEKE